jgi:hypothetical protein
VRQVVRGGLVPDDVKQSVHTYRQVQTQREALSWPAAQREAEMMNQAVQPRRSAGKGTANHRIRALHEDPLTAIGKEATTPASEELDLKHSSL